MKKFLIQLLNVLNNFCESIVILIFDILVLIIRILIILLKAYISFLIKFSDNFNYKLRDFKKSNYYYLKYDFFRFNLKNNLKSVKVTKEIIKDSADKMEFQGLLSARFKNYKGHLKNNIKNKVKWFFKYLLIIIFFTMCTVILVNNDCTFIYTFFIDTTLDYPDEPMGVDEWWYYDRWNIGDTYNTLEKFEIPYTEGLIDLETEFDGINLLDYYGFILLVEEMELQPLPEEYLELINMEFQMMQDVSRVKIKTLLNFNDEYDLYMEYQNNKRLFFLIRILMILKILTVLIVLNSIFLMMFFFGLVIYNDVQSFKMNKKIKNKY